MHLEKPNLIKPASKASGLIHQYEDEKMTKQKRILIVRQDRIGDVVLSTHIPREIKKKWDKSFVAVLVSNYTKDVYLNNPYVDKIILYDDIAPAGFKNFFKKVKEIRSYKFNYALMLLPSERINYMLFLAGIIHRVGVGQKFYQFITFAKGVSRHKYIPLRHEADYCMDLARRIGIKTNNITPEIFLTDEEQNKIIKIRSRAKENGKYLIGINTTSKNSAPNLPPEVYLNLINRLKKNESYQVVVTDYEVPEILTDIDGVEYPNDRLALRRSIINIASLDCLISSSTGPMHIAAAFGVYTISVFCSLNACSPELWGPIGNRNKIILPDDNYCGHNCSRDPKTCTFAGKGGISVGKILVALKEFIEEKENVKAPMVYEKLQKVFVK